MNLTDRQPVEGTQPTIYIGHRVYRRANGQRVASRRWTAEYCIDGRQQFEALRTPSKDEAIRKVWEIVQRLQRGQTAPARTRTTLKEVCEDYLNLQGARQRAPRTIEKYELVVRNLLEWSDDGGGRRRAASFREDDFWRFHRFLRDQGLVAKTCYDRATVVKQIFKSAAKRGLIPHNPLAGIQIAKPASAPQPCFTPSQVGKMLDMADVRLRPIIAMLAYTGMRFGELRDLQWSDVLLEQGSHGYIVIRRGGSAETTKNKRLRRVPMHPRLRQLIDDLPRNHDLVFTTQPSNRYPEGGRPLRERNVLVALKRLCRRCGFPDPLQYKLHSLRHSFASMCARTNVSYKYALEWMGHRSSDILDMYYSMFDDTAEAAMKTITYPQQTNEEDKPAA